MRPPSFWNIKAVVQDLCNRQAKFGNLEACKRALNNKYQETNVIYDTERYTVTEYAKKKHVEASVTVFEFKDKKGSYGYIADYTVNNKDPMIYSTYEGDIPEYGNGNFVAIQGVDKWHGYEYKIIDSNRNGYVDENDTIEIKGPMYDKHRTITQTISSFLGLDKAMSSDNDAEQEEPTAVSSDKETEPEQSTAE